MSSEAGGLQWQVTFAGFSLKQHSNNLREIWRKSRLDVCQHLDEKEPRGSWDEFLQPSVDASSALR